MIRIDLDLVFCFILDIIKYMIITYFGKQFFKIQKGDLTLAFNPIGKNSKEYKGSRFGSDIAFSTTNHPDYNGFEMTSHGDALPFEIKGPGDYEIKDIFIKGILTETEINKNKFINTIYTLSVENISICFLGALNQSKLDTSIKGEIGSPDILFVPVNDEFLSPSDAYKLAVSLEPKIIIPMDYDDKSLKSFIKEGGQDNIKKIEKLTIKPKDILDKQAEVIVFS